MVDSSVQGDNDDGQPIVRDDMMIGAVEGDHGGTESLEVLVMALEALHEEAKSLGLEVSWLKTKVQVFGGLLDETVQSVHACGEDIEILESFAYLGSAVNNDGGSCQEVLRRIGIAHGVMDSLSGSIWRCQYPCSRTKIRIFKLLRIPVLIYGCETWTLNSDLKRRIDAFGNKCLRRIMGYRSDDYVSNQLLHHETESRPLTCIVRQCQLRLYGHVARYPETDPSHQVVSVRYNPAQRGGGQGGAHKARGWGKLRFLVESCLGHEVSSGSGAAACCDPTKGLFRFVALFFMCLLGFGSYFCYDTPGSLQDHIKEDMNVNTLQFASLYSLYSWPNVVLCFVGGFLIDRVFGIRWGTIIFSSIVTVGQFVYAMGALVNQFWIMQLGRFIFGIGGESLAVAQNTYTVSWFKGKELNTVFGLQLSMARVGSTVNFLSMVPLYNWVQTFSDGYKALGYSLLFAGITCVFSLACALILGVFDRKRSKALHLEAATSGEKVKLTDVLTFPLSFWLISVICVSYYVAIFPFIGLAK
ncbi:Major facilitator superfamily domain-containing protein 1 [Chionoecetes opilio]|uniref:Lysosomal dipeptide transporter MFSD1 n=1 Tax=Chionoecetes opilio TaxID=41210 RepID=A0A8J5CHT7_CHIOP|nr:Major facilitator superfamily domain-containing protein 1 [Chionoecetes opilio]